MTTDEGRELLCNIQRPYCRPAHRNFASEVLCRRLYEHHINFSAIFSPTCRSPDSLQEMAGPPPSPCASHSEVSGRLGTRKFGPNANQNLLLSPLRVVISLAMAGPLHLPPTMATSTGLRFVMFLAFVRRVKQVRSAGSTAPRNWRRDRLSRCCSRPSPSACRHSRRRDNCRRFCRQGSYSQTCSATPRRP